MQSVALMHVEGDGHFRKNGLEGYFVLLRNNQWKLGQDFNLLGEEINNNRNAERDLVFIRLNKDENNKLSLGEYYDMKFPAGILGVRFVDFNLPIELYEEVVSRMNSGK